ELQAKLLTFMDEHIYPNEKAYKAEIDRNGVEKGNRWLPTQIIEDLKPKAREQGLWNLFLPKSVRAPEGLSNLDYAPLCEIMGRVGWAPEVFNCSAPDTGNMETIERYGSEEHKKQWLEPLLRGEMRSAFAMTEPAVASSDATNIETRIERDGDEYVINGHKWWISGAGDPRCKIFILMGKTDPGAARHSQQSMILVPTDTPGVNIRRPLPVFGYDDAPHGHCEITYENVRVPASSLLLGEGRGFEIAQGRLGPGRIHHCMRAIGVAERALALMVDRVNTRIAFGKPLAEQGVVQQQVALSRNEIDQARLLCHKAAWVIDEKGNKEARNEVAMIKAVAPQMACNVIDRAIQVHGAAGVSDDTVLARLYGWHRAMRLFDGPDEVHIRSIARAELGREKSPFATAACRQSGRAATS
ncbi:MAG: acyl-CoA dehydrogenase, partial [Mycobacterium sp.]|nr:acyl-CoA dehydrogenase [Mycobacterium sp.]